MKRLLLCSLLASGSYLQAMQPAASSASANTQSLYAQLRSYVNLNRLFLRLGQMMSSDDERSTLELTKAIGTILIDSLKLDAIKVNVGAEEVELGRLFDTTKLKGFLIRLNNDFAEQKIQITKQGINKAQAASYLRLLKACLRPTDDSTVTIARASLDSALAPLENRDVPGGATPLSSFIPSIGLGFERFIDFDQATAVLMQDGPIELPQVIQCIPFKRMLLSYPTDELPELCDACCGMTYYIIRALQSPSQALELLFQAFALFYREQSLPQHNESVSAARPATSSSSSRPAASASSSTDRRPTTALARATQNNSRLAQARTPYQKLRVYCNIPSLMLAIGAAFADDAPSSTAQQTNDILAAIIDALNLGIFPINFNGYGKTTIGTIFNVPSLKTLLMNLIRDLCSGMPLNQESEKAYVEDLQASINFDQIGRVYGASQRRATETLFSAAIGYYNGSISDINLSGLLQRIGLNYLNIDALSSILRRPTSSILAADIVSCLNFKPFLQQFDSSSDQIDQLNEALQGLVVILHASLRDRGATEANVLHAFALLFREASIVLVKPKHTPQALWDRANDIEKAILMESAGMKAPARILAKPAPRSASVASSSVTTESIDRELWDSLSPEERTFIMQSLVKAPARPSAKAPAVRRAASAASSAVPGDSDEWESLSDLEKALRLSMSDR